MVIHTENGKKHLKLSSNNSYDEVNSLQATKISSKKIVLDNIYHKREVKLNFDNFIMILTDWASNYVV